MNGEFLIDGLNSLTTFGIIVSYGGYRDIDMYAPTKDVNISSYKEIDGIAADLSEVYLKNKTIKINFAILENREIESREDGRYTGFLRHIRDKSYHDYTFIDLGITERLRYVSESKIDITEKFTSVTIEFADDFPKKYENETPILTNIIPAQRIEIDDINLSLYGIRLVGENTNEILKNAKAKHHLERTNSGMDSVKYTNNNVTFEGKEITISLLMRANDLTTFWNN
jgi:hypothetical protein